MQNYIIKTEEIEENGETYIIDTFINGAVVKNIKSEPPEPIKQPTTGVQRGHTKLIGTSVAIPLELIDVSKAAVQLVVQGTTARYTYTLAEDALTVSFVKPVQAWINWEVRG